MIAFQCPKCQASLKSTDDKAGLKSKCPKCGFAVKVPVEPTFTVVDEVLPIEPPKRTRSVTTPASKRPAFVGEDVPRQRRFPVWLLAVTIPAGVLLLCCIWSILLLLFGTGHSKSGLSSSTIDLLGSGQLGRLDQEIRIGDLGVTVYCFGTDCILQGETAFRDNLPFTGERFCFGLKFVNYNPNRKITVSSQSDSARLVDEHGNSYSHVTVTQELGVPIQTTCIFRMGQSGQIAVRQIMSGKFKEVRSDEIATDCLIFKEPVPGAQELTLTMDKALWGDSGNLVIKVRRVAKEKFGIPRWFYAPSADIWTDKSDQELQQEQKERQDKSAQEKQRLQEERAKAAEEQERRREELQRTLKERSERAAEDLKRRQESIRMPKGRRDSRKDKNRAK